MAAICGAKGSHLWSEGQPFVERRAAICGAKGSHLWSEWQPFVERMAAEHLLSAHYASLILLSAHYASVMLFFLSCLQAAHTTTANHADKVHGKNRLG
jgi:hypothetical protein